VRRIPGLHILPGFEGWLTLLFAVSSEYRQVVFDGKNRLLRDQAGRMARALAALMLLLINASNSR